MANSVISVRNIVVGESDAFADFVVMLSAPSASAVTVAFATQAGSAAANNDYDQTFGNLTFAAGETVKTVRVPVINDATAEAKESFYFVLSSPTNAMIGNDYALATIIDNDAASGTPVMAIGDRVVDETAGLVTFTITLDRPSTGTVSVNYATAPGTATAADYTTVSGTLAFAPGETAKTVSVPITNDAIAEADERFDLVLSGAVGATLPDPRGTAVIAASDQTTVSAPVISTDNVTVGESDGYAEFVVRLSAPSASAVTVAFATQAGSAAANNDYDQTFGNLTFAAGETVKTVRVPVINDATAEAKESFYFVLSSPTNAMIGNDYALATIIDNDAASGTPVMAIGDRVVDETAGLVTFTITLDRPSTGTVSVNYATAPGTATAADDTTVSGTLAFAPGETAKTVSVPITNDAIAEADERFDLVLSGVVGATLPDPRGTAVIAASDQTTVSAPVISTDNVTVGESDGYAEFVVRLSAPSASAVTVAFATQAGSAAANNDYDQTFGNLTFAAGETVKTVRVPVINDATAEAKESFYFVLSSPTNAMIGNDYALATIIDNDAASGTPVMAIGDRVVDETAGLVTFTITLDRPSTGTVSVNYATAPGTATAADYTTVSGTLAFAPGETAKTVSVPITNDAIAEADERFDLVLSGVVGAILPDPRGTAVIAASDQTTVSAPVISTDNVTVGESDGYAEFVVRLSAPSASAVTVAFATQAGSAAANNDYDQTFGNLTFAAGETVKTVRVPVINDATAEAKESFYFVLSSPTNAMIGNDYALATIIDNDAASGTPVMAIGDRVVDETAGLVTFTITLDRPSTGTVSVNYATAPGTATAADYTTVSGTLAFAPGETAKTVSVPITNDAIAEADERFDLVLSGAVGATLPDPRGTAVIAASDQTTVSAPVISTDNVTVGESDGYAEFVVRLSAPSASAVTVAFATQAGSAAANNDYDQTFGNLTFAAGETVKTVRVPVINDATAEAKESFYFVLSSPTNAMIGNDYALATIIDNDAASGTPVMAIGDRVVDETAGLVTFTITLDRPSTGTVSVNYATAPGTATAADYTTVSGTLAFAPGETAKTVSVPITNDAIAEADERFDLVLSGVVGAILPDPRGTAVIAASDQTTVSAPVISTDNVTVGESDGYAEFVVRLNAPSASAVTVAFATQAGSAAANNDYDQTFGNLTFAAGETVKTVRIPIINDATVEPDETFSFKLSGPINATIAPGSSQVTATILDDDTAPVLGYGNSNDTYVVNQSATRIIEALNGGTDLVRSSVTYTLGANVENLTLAGAASINGTGNSGNNVIIGNAGNNVLSGLGGVDTVSYATATAGVTVSLAVTSAQNTIGAGTDTLSGFENLTGSAFADTLTGTSGANVINGAAGADTMAGGAGNDIYYVDNAADKVNEAAGQGTDTVYASVSYILTAGSEIEYLRGNAGATGLTLFGNALNNTIVGGIGNDTLNGGAGADVMAGGTGNDTYYVDNAGDVVNEAAGAGTDTVRTTLLSKMLGANLENLTFIGSGNFTGTGNTLNNVITGGVGNDTLNGGAGNDTLNGGNGNDVLVGGTGADVLTGGAGADVFRFSALADSTVAAGGRDTIKDFVGGDKIDLHLIDANASLPGDQAFSFIGTNAFSGTAGQLRYAASGGNTLITGDVNGDKVANFSILVSGAHAFGASDFVL